MSVASIQQPIFSPFSRESTSEEVTSDQDLTGNLAIVTGATAGLGIETARVLALRGAEVLLLGRNQKKGQEIVEALKIETGNTQVSMMSVDLNSLQSVRNFSSEIVKSGHSVDLLINNAGIMATPFELCEFGFESQLFVNYVSHLVLSSELSPALLKSNQSRIVCLTSLGHHMSSLHLDDLNFDQREYDKWRAYGQSKTATSLLAVYLNNRLKDYGVLATSVHPGVIAETSLGRYLSPEEQQAALATSSKSKPKTLAQGAATTLWAATSPLLQEYGGTYLEDCNIASVVDKPNFQYGVLPYAICSEKAEALASHVENVLGNKLFASI